MRRLVVVVGVVVLVGSAAAVALASGIPNEWSGPDNAKPRIDFSARYRAGRVVELRRFSWDSLSCRDGGFPETAQFAQSIRVKDRRFSHVELLHIENGLRVKAWGRFDAAGTKATGGIMVERGSPSCVGGSGIVRWVATPK